MNTNQNITSVIALISSTFSELSPDSRSEFEKLLTINTFDKNTIIVREGQYSDKLFYIITGCLRAYYLKEDKKITDWFGFENDFICSINSYFLEIPSPHYIETIEPATLMVISRSDINKLCAKHHDFERLAKVAVTKTMLQLQQRIVSMQFETAQQKYENLTALRPDISQRVPLGHIASYLGMTIETLSRIRKPKSRI